MTLLDKKRNDRWKKLKKILDEKYYIDVKMGCKKTYVEWLEDQYCDLSDIFDGVNEQRLKLIGEKYKEEEK